MRERDRTNWIVVTAGGKGSRLEAGMNKVFVPLLGEPIVCRTLKFLDDCGIVERIVITIGETDLPQLKELLEEYKFKKVVGLILAKETRQDSTLEALKWIEGQGAKPDDLVGVHNAVNLFVTNQEIENVFAAAEEFGGALLAVPAKDTVKIANEAGFVSETPVRQMVWYAQTPQVGRLGAMLDAFRQAEKDNFNGTDDTQLLERAGIRVKIVPCSPDNFKITFPSDLIMAETILRRRQK